MMRYAITGPETARPMDSKFGVLIHGLEAAPPSEEGTGDADCFLLLKAAVLGISGIALALLVGWEEERAWFPADSLLYCLLSSGRYTADLADGPVNMLQTWKGVCCAGCCVI